MRVKKLDQAAIGAGLHRLHGWRLNEDRLCKAFRFKDFVEAFAFMTQVALLAEGMHHHPDWRNSFGVVDVSLSTHDVGGISELDFELAAKMERVAMRLIAGDDSP